MIEGDHIHDVSEEACSFCMQSLSVVPHVRSRNDAATEIAVRQAHERITLWLRGDRSHDNLEVAFYALGSAVSPTDS